MIHTRSATQSNRVKLPEVRGTECVNPNLKPEKPAVKQTNKLNEAHISVETKIQFQCKPGIGQDRPQNKQKNFSQIPYVSTTSYRSAT